VVEVSCHASTDFFFVLHIYCSFQVDGVSVIGASTEWFTDSILGVPGTRTRTRRILTTSRCYTAGSTVTLKFQRRSRGRPAPGMIESVVVLTRGGNAT
jgi:hypothetical protein